VWCGEEASFELADQVNVGMLERDGISRGNAGRVHVRKRGIAHLPGRG